MADFYKRIFVPPIRERRPGPWAAFVTRKRSLFPWQQQSVDFLWGVRAGLCLDQPGLGKTAVAVTLAAAAYNAGVCKSPVIVAPSSVLSGGCWVEELDQLEDVPPIRFVAYERLSRDASLLRDCDWVWCDECHHIRGPKSRMTKALTSSKPVCRYGATATPFWANDLLDMVPLLSWQGLVQADYKGVQRLCGYRDGGRWRPWLWVERHVKRWLRLVSVRHTRDLLCLPDSVTVERLLAAKEQATLIGGGLHLRNSALLLQREATLNSDKLPYARRLARHWAALGHRVLLWTRFTEAHAWLEQELSVKGISGETAAGRRKQVLEDFRRGSQKILPLTYGVGGEGWSLPEASVSICVDRPWTAAEVEQARSRVLRPGQQRRTVHYYLTARGTIDERIREVVSVRERSFDEYLAGLAEGGAV